MSKYVDDSQTMIEWLANVDAMMNDVLQGNELTLDERRTIYLNVNRMGTILRETFLNVETQADSYRKKAENARKKTEKELNNTIANIYLLDGFGMKIGVPRKGEFE